MEARAFYEQLIIDTSSHFAGKWVNAPAGINLISDQSERSRKKLSLVARILNSCDQPHASLL